MPKQYGKCRSLAQLSVKDLEDKKKNILRSEPSKDVSVHFTWALVLTISCFFVIGPCWALYKTRELRRMIAQKEFKEATHLSNKMSAVLLVSTVIGAVTWVAFLFCTVGLLLIGLLLNTKSI